MPIQDDYGYGMDAEPFPPRQQEEEPVPQQHTTSETAEAPMRRRARPAPKVIAPDATLELRNGDLARWNTDYVFTMQEALRHKQQGRAATIAKKNAEQWVLGTSTLATLGQADRLVQLPTPLDMFSGAKLLELFTGLQLTPGGEKRTRQALAEEDDVTAPVRKRSRGNESSSEQGRGFADDGYMPMMGDAYNGMEIEQGREAPTPLDDRQLSGTFPWNQSAGSRRPTSVFGSASLPGGAQPAGNILGRRGSRLPTASPLMGRGLPGPDTDDVSDPPQAVMYSDLGGGGAAGDDLAMTGIDDFELYGPAAQVDTQTAAQSQWQRAALDSESNNFLAFVQTAIAEADEAREKAVPGDEEAEQVSGSVEFETLLPPEKNTRIVAAQGLLHVLALGTKNLLRVEQEETFGPILMRGVGVDR